MTGDSQQRTDIMVVIAHPDDELLCAGVVAHHARRGRSVVIAVVTGGEGGPPPDNVHMDPQAIARMRREEFLNSASVLGVDGVECLGFVDRGYLAEGVTSELTDDLTQVTRKITELLEKYRPKVVLTHGPDGEYGSNHHIAVCQCMTEAVGQCRDDDGPVLYYCNAYDPEAPLPRSNTSVRADYVFPVTGRNYEARRRAMLCHASQWPNFIGYFGPDMARECYHRVGPANEHSRWFEVAVD